VWLNPVLVVIKERRKWHLPKDGDSGCLLSQDAAAAQIRDPIAIFAKRQSWQFRRATVGGQLHDAAPSASRALGLLDNQAMSSAQVVPSPGERDGRPFIGGVAAATRTRSGAERPARLKPGQRSPQVRRAE